MLYIKLYVVVMDIIMSLDLNKVMLIGRLGGDVSMRSTQNGKELACFSVATGERWKDKATGELRERTTWHRIVIFNENLVDIARKSLSKGSKVYIEGCLQTRKWVDDSGNEKYVTEIVLQQFNGMLLLLDNKSYSESTDKLHEDLLDTNTDNFDDELPF